MATYIVTEEVEYRVEADSEEDACHQVSLNENRDAYCIGCYNRTATLEEE